MHIWGSWSFYHPVSLFNVSCAVAEVPRINPEAERGVWQLHVFTYLELESHLLNLALQRLYNNYVTFFKLGFYIMMVRIKCNTIWTALNLQWVVILRVPRSENASEGIARDRGREEGWWRGAAYFYFWDTFFLPPYEFFLILNILSFRTLRVVCIHEM